MTYQLRTPILPIYDDYSILEVLFAARGIPPEDIDHYLHTTKADILSPSLIANIDDGIKMLIQHIFNNDKIFIQVDSDCDGYTSAAVLINYINCFAPGYAQNNIIYRIHEGKQHGLIPDTIPNEVKLVIAPDSSSNDYDQHKELKQRGCDVLVIDHHEAEKISPYACVINNQLCNYPNKTLSGVGMVYKFCSRLDELAGYNYANQFLDLTALGLIGDMMDLRNFETKYLIEEGLTDIRNPFFKEMIKTQNYSIDRAGGLCPFSVSFYVVPQINGTIRMGTFEEKILLFESMLDFKGYESILSTKRGCKGQFEPRVEQACRVCGSVKRLQSKVVESNLGIIEAIISKNKLDDNKIIAVKLDKKHSINRNLTGLIANQLVSKYQHPILILSEDADTNGETVWEGSGRGYETKDFDDLKKFLKDSHKVFLAEGHPNACGVGITEKNFNSFIEYSNEALKDCQFEPCQKVDFIWQGNHFKGQNIIDLASLNLLWGQGLEKPYIAIEHLQVQPNQVFLMSKDKNPTLKIELSNGVSLIKFKASEEEYNKLIENPNGSVVLNIVGTCNINEWNGRITPQIEVSNYEVIGVNKYYF